MKAVWQLVAMTVIGLAGCTPMPKRQMRPPAAEEFSTPPADLYTTPPDVPRQEPLLTPKSTTPPLNANPGMGGMGGPGMGAGGAPGGMRR